MELDELKGEIVDAICAVNRLDPADRRWVEQDVSVMFGVLEAKGFDMEKMFR